MDDIFKNYDSREGMGAAFYAVLMMLLLFGAFGAVVLTIILK